MGYVKMHGFYAEQQKKRIFCIFGIVYKLVFKYWSNDICKVLLMYWTCEVSNASQMDGSFE